MKATITFLLILLTTIQLFSQLDFGVTLGSGLTRFNGKYASDWGAADADPSFALKFHAGVFASYPLDEKISIESGLFYTGAGTNYSGTIGPDDITYRKQLVYLILPVLLQYKLNEKFSAYVGPRLGMLLSAIVVNDASQTVLDSYFLDEKENAKDYYKATDFGLDFGLGYMLNENISLKFSSDLGLAKIATYGVYVIESNGYPRLKSVTNGNDIVYDVKNFGIRFSVSYRF